MTITRLALRTSVFLEFWKSRVSPPSPSVEPIVGWRMSYSHTNYSGGRYRASLQLLTYGHLPWQSLKYDHQNYSLITSLTHVYMYDSDTRRAIAVLSTAMWRCRYFLCSEWPSARTRRLPGDPQQHMVDAGTMLARRPSPAAFSRVSLLVCISDSLSSRLSVRRMTRMMSNLLYINVNFCVAILSTNWCCWIITHMHAFFLRDIETLPVDFRGSSEIELPFPMPARTYLIIQGAYTEGIQGYSPKRVPSAKRKSDFEVECWEKQYGQSQSKGSEVM